MFKIMMFLILALYPFLVWGLYKLSRWAAAPGDVQPKHKEEL